MTLNAAAMLDNALLRQRDDNHNYRPEFKYDFNEKATKNLILGSTDRHADNALFYQLIVSQYGENNIRRYRRRADCIFKSIIYVNFESIFSVQKKREDRRKKIGYSINNSKEWSKDEIDDKCSVLFEDGF